MTAMSDISAEGLPDFVIIGAMKAGTTSLHYLLDAHPDVFIPDSEIFFFDIDEFDCHHDFAVAPDGGWIDRDFERHFDEYLSWYRSFFEPAPDARPERVVEPVRFQQATTPD
ncbi:MAG: sulfotransferase, partial [Bradymonadaceae bacterium]